MCFDGSSEDGGSENDGYISFADMFDGGGPGRSGARFSGAGVGALDQNKDNYISEAEYLSGEQHSKTNKQRGISGPDDGPIGYAYDNRNNFISGISNSFGALPRGSIASEAALGSDGLDISTSGIARFMQGGGVLGAMGRGLTGGNIMSPEYVAPEMGDMTRDEYDRAIVKSFNSIGNTGEQPVPQEVAAAMGRIRGLNPRAVSVPKVISGYDDDPILYDQIMSAYDNEEFSNPFAVNVSTMPNYDIRKISDNNSGGTYTVTGTNSDGTAVNGKFNGEYLMENGFIK